MIQTECMLERNRTEIKVVKLMMLLLVLLVMMMS